MQQTTMAHSDELLQLVTFKVSEEEFGIEIFLVKEIIRMLDITKIPNAPDFVEGVVNLRGKVIPIIDMRKRFGLNSIDYNKQTRIVVVEMSAIFMGFVVDAVSEVLRIPADTVEPPPPVVAGIDSEYISGVGKLEDRLLIMLDLNKLLKTEEQSSLNQLQLK